jgi:hypothetical protein
LKGIRNVETSIVAKVMVLGSTSLLKKVEHH